MTMISILVNFLPWHSWLSIAAILVLLTYLGLWPLVIGFVKRVPWQAWAVLGVVILFWIWLDFHDTSLRAEVKKERDDYWEAQEKIAKEGFDKAIATKRAEVADLKAAQIKTNADWTTVYNFALKQADVRVAKALKEVSKYVTPTADAKCIVPVGFLLHAGQAVDAANGRGDGAEGQVDSKAVPEEALELVDRASGIPLSAVDGWIQQLTGVGQKWRERALKCDVWIDQQAVEFEKDRPPP